MKKILTFFLTGLSFTGFAQLPEGVNEEDLVRYGTATASFQTDSKNPSYTSKQTTLLCCKVNHNCHLLSNHFVFDTAHKNTKHSLYKIICLTASCRLQEDFANDLFLFPQPFQANYREPQSNK